MLINFRISLITRRFFRYFDSHSDKTVTLSKLLQDINNFSKTIVGVIRNSHQFSFKIVRLITIVVSNPVNFLVNSLIRRQLILDDVTIFRHLAVESTFLYSLHHDYNSKRSLFIYCCVKYEIFYINVISILFAYIYMRIRPANISFTPRLIAVSRPTVSNSCASTLIIRSFIIIFEMSSACPNTKYRRFSQLPKLLLEHIRHRKWEDIIKGATNYCPLPYIHSTADHIRCPTGANYSPSAERTISSKNIETSI